MSDAEPSNLPPIAIAVVGMAGRFPGAKNVAEFWRNLREGVESIKRFTDEELSAAGVSSELLQDPDYVKAGVVLDDLEMFDASFFGFSPRDASIMDPQHRQFLECAWEALEDAGHTPEQFKGSIGVYAGSGMNTYLIYNLLTNRKLMESAGLFLLKQTGNDKDVLATRLSYQFDLRGPSINVQTACSTSLVAVHMACQSLLNHECDMALAGGVTIEMPHRTGYLYREGEILSQDGHCRSFDAQSTGTVFGSGLGIVVLRRLEDAIRDHDTIHAIVRGSAINNDGARKVGYLAPSVEGQAEVITEALGVAGVEAESISYVETHGTGTKVGDPIEISGLTQAYRESTARKGFCAIGSVKTNIGHLDAAAGVTGFIKTVLALKHGQIPPTLHFDKPNPHIDFAATPFYVNSRLRDWESGGGPRRAGVTSLGIGGTNAHVILEEFPAVERARVNRSWQLLTISARSAVALDAACANLAEHLRKNPGLHVADVAFTCEAGRKAFRYRRTVVCRSTEAAVDALRVSDASEVSDAGDGREREVVFLFSGQGSQHVGMGRELYQKEPEFRKQVDRCAHLLLPHLGLDLSTILYPAEAQAESAREQLNQTRLTQPALFVIEYALAKLWMSWGIVPSAMVGHSIGEYVVACLAGVFSLEDALTTIAARGRLMQSLPPGVMTAVPLAEQEVRPLLSGQIALAAVNGPRQCVVSGSLEAVAKFEEELQKQDVACKRLNTSHAFHSSMMEPILGAFTEVVRKCALHVPKIPYLSNLTGNWITAADATDPEYWAKHLRGTVRFADALSELFREAGRILLEVGPGQTLSSLARQNPGRPKEQRVCQSMPHANDPRSDMQVLLTALGQIWGSGKRVSWEAFRSLDQAYRIALPTYPFEHQRYWIEPGDHALGVPRPATVTVRKAAKPDNWFYLPSWKKVPAGPPAGGGAGMQWLIFTDERIGPLVAEHLRRTGGRVVTVAAGHSFRAGDGSYTIRPGDAADYDSLVGDLVERRRIPGRILNLWPLDAPQGVGSLEKSQNACFFSLLFLAQALGNQELAGLEITIASECMQRVAGEPVLRPESALVLGPCKVIPREYPGILCRSVDISLAQEEYATAAAQIVQEAMAGGAGKIAAYRSGQRWEETFEPVALDGARPQLGLKERGVYLITGGLGGIGLAVAERLAREVHARLILTGRTALPPREKWEEWLGARASEPFSAKIRKVLELERAGGEVLAMRADVSSLPDMQRVLAEARERFGAIDGVIHAAGVLNDGLIQLKTREAAQAVLDPKVKGTLILGELLRDSKPGFLALFSSVSSIVPPAGQVDYSAANAFLDGYARSLPDIAGQTVAINWGLWRDVGMGMGTSSNLPALDHPLFEAASSDAAGARIYSGRLSRRTHWILEEHRFRSGKALFPGTGYLEMAVAAMSAGVNGDGIELRDVFFMAPLGCDLEETREVRIRLRTAKDGVSFSVASKIGGKPQWEEFASGTGGRAEGSRPARVVPEEILARCNVREIDFRQRKTKQEKYFDFGKRWRSLQTFRIGQGEAVAVLELPAEFQNDLAQFKMHPALVDIATGSALYLIRDYEATEDLYLPISYRKLTVWGRLPSRIYSHIRLTGENTGRREAATFDISIVDEHGDSVIDIEGYSMRRISDPAAIEVRNPARAAERPSPVEVLQERRRREAIPTEEGITALLRILSTAGSATNVVVSPVDLSDLQKPDDQLASRTGEPLAGKPSAPENGSREAPRDEIESMLAGWWGELLGIEQVGINDDFFELGGHSLIAVRLFTKLKKAYQLEIDLAILFEARTVAKLAAVIRKAMGQERSAPKPWSSLVAIQPSGSKPPLYFISGVGGNVLNFQAVSKYLGTDQPVYALQPPGLDGKQPFLTRMEEIAGHYLNEIAARQPEGPYYLAGYSFGGFVSFEMAQQLHAKGKTVGLLVLIDTIEWSYWERVRNTLSFADRWKLNKSRAKYLMHRDGRAHMWKRLQDKWHRSVIRLSEAARRPLPKGLSTIADANWAAIEHYTPRAYPGRVTLVRCSERSVLDGDDYLLGWGDLVSEKISVKEVPGHHLNITKEPNVRVLATTLAESIDEAAGELKSEALWTAR